MPISIASFSTQLSGFISATTEITDLLGTLNGLKAFYKNRLPQNPVYDALTFEKVDVNSVEVMSGPSDYDIVRVQFTAYSLNSSNPEIIIDAVREKFDRFKDNNGAVEFHQTKYITRTGTLQDYDTKVWMESIDFYFHIK